MNFHKKDKTFTALRVPILIENDDADMNVKDGTNLKFSSFGLFYVHNGIQI